MGRYKNGINGPFKGKIGNVVGLSWMGMDIMRSVPEPSSKKATDAQLHQRKMLAVASSWLRPLKALIWVGYQHFISGKSPMNSAVSFTMKHALTSENGAWQIDFSKVVLSRGELLISIVQELVVAGTLLHIKWANVPASALNNDADRATFIVYNRAKEQFVTFEAVAQRGDREVMLQLPVKFTGDTVYTWMYYVSVAGTSVSTSIYLGEYFLGVV